MLTTINKAFIIKPYAYKGETFILTFFRGVR